MASASRIYLRRVQKQDVGPDKEARFALGSPLEGADSNPRSPRLAQLSRLMHAKRFEDIVRANSDAAAVQLIFFAADASTEPGAYTVGLGCGLLRCSAASACRRYNSYIPSLFIGSTNNSLNAQTKASTRSGEYPAAARSISEVKFVIWSSSCGKG